MRPVLKVVAVSLLLGSSARAADLTGVLADYLLRKVPPSTQVVFPAGAYNALGIKLPTAIQMMQWKNPVRLKADELDFMYFYELGTSYWMAVIKHPQVPVASYVGTQNLMKSSSSGNVWQVMDGPYKAYFVLMTSKTSDGSFLLASPQMVLYIPTFSRAVK